MPRRTRLAILLAVTMLAISAPARAQLGGLIKKVPKPPVPVVPSPPGSTSEEPKRKFTAELIDKMIVGMKAERVALEKETREANAARARLQAAQAGKDEEQQERLMAMMEANMEGQQKYEECLETAMQKDPDYIKLERLEMQAEDELDDDKAAALNEQVSALRDKIRKRVEPACASKKDEAAGRMKQMIEDDAEKRRKEEEIISGVQTRAAMAGAQEAKMTKEDYAAWKEDLCVATLSSGRLNSEDQALIDARAADLRPPLRALGCGVGTTWGTPDPPLK